MLHNSPTTTTTINNLHLIRLLLLSASAADRLDPLSTSQSLLLLYPLLSLSGNPIQRLAAYFSDTILSSLLPPSSLLLSPSPHQHFSAFTSLYTSSPHLQFAHFTANQSILEAFQANQHHRNSSHLHVIDLNISYGFQWPSLIQSLAADQSHKPNPMLRITGFGRTEAELNEAEAWLSAFAKGFRNLCFEFEGRRIDCGLRDLELRENSTLVVNSVFGLNHVLNSSSALKSIRSLNPSLMVFVEKEGGRSEGTCGSSFLSRFVESLHYFAAMFDSLDECFPEDSEERLRIERDYLGREIRNAVEMEGGGGRGVLMEYGRFETWKEVMERSGFEGVVMSSRSVSQAKLLLKIRNHWTDMEGHGGGGGGGVGFRISERDGGRGLSLGWQDRFLVTATAWRCSSL